VCGGRLQPVLDSIALMHKMGVWVEVTTLVVPGTNDTDEELTRIAEFIAGVSADIPWHVSRFHPDYKMTDRGATPVGTIHRALEIGRKAGLHYVYGGNIAGDESESTFCHSCRAALIRRFGFSVLETRFIRDAEGRASCPRCGTAVPLVLS